MQKPSIIDRRRMRLREWIDQRFEGNVSAFAEKTGISQPQIADTLDGRKSFGEKVARRIEVAAGMPKGWLSSDITEDDLTLLKAFHDANEATQRGIKTLLDIQKNPLDSPEEVDDQAQKE